MITLTALEVLGLIILGGVIGAVCIYIISSCDRESKDCRNCEAKDEMLRSLGEEIDPYKGMTNMEIAKRDDRERKLKLKK